MINDSFILGMACSGCSKIFLNRIALASPKLRMNLCYFLSTYSHIYRIVSQCHPTRVLCAIVDLIFGFREILMRRDKSVENFNSSQRKKLYKIFESRRCSKLNRLNNLYHVKCPHYQFHYLYFFPSPFAELN